VAEIFVVALEEFSMSPAGRGRRARKLLPPCIALLCAAWAAAARAQVPYLVQDLDTSPALGTFSGGGDSFALGSRVYFSAADAENGQEPWTTDGTGAGTALLADLCPGSCWSRPRFLGAVRGMMVGFAYAAPGNGSPSLWRSDGTTAGTSVLAAADGGPVTPALDPDFLAGAYAVVGDRLYFDGSSPALPIPQLWRTDGTSAGTQPVSAWAPQLANAAGDSLTAFGGRLLFTTGDGSLWTSDGSAAGTAKLQGFAGGRPDLLTVAGRRLFFVVNGFGSAATALWVSDGTAAGTRSVLSFAPADAFSDTAFLKAAGDQVLFAANDGQHGLQLWVSDGTAAGGRRLTAFSARFPFGGDLSRPDPTLGAAQVATVNGFAVFVAQEAGDAGFKVWSAPIVPGPGGPVQAALCGSPCVFPGDHVLAAGSWVWFATAAGVASTDGTPERTSVVRLACAPGTCTISSQLTPALGAALFAVRHEGPPRTELWRTDATAAGTRRIGVLAPVPRRGGQLDVAVLGGSVVIAASEDEGNLTGSGALRLWISDGTAAGTRPFSGGLMDGSSFPERFMAQGDRVLFTLDQGVHAGELWEAQAAPGSATLLAQQYALTPLAATAATAYLLGSDPVAPYSHQIWTSQRAAPTPTLVADLAGSHYDSFVSSAAIFRGQLYLAIQSDNSLNPWDKQVFKSDGTPGGTGPAFDLPANFVVPGNLTPVGARLYLTSDDPAGGQEVLVSDGTAAGTTVLTHFGSAFPSCGPQLTSIGSTVFFVGWDAGSGREVWRTDGTPGGTALVADLVPGKDGSNPTELTSHQGALYFFAVTQPQRKGLWRSDGSAGGTVQIADFPASGAPSFGCDPQPNQLTSTGGLLFFVIDDGVHGAELWQSDGTAAGTALVKDIFPGPGSAVPSGLTAAAGRLYFAADDGEHGFELWRSDGTAAGTRMVADLAPGPGSSFPGNLTVAGDTLFFAADDGVTGRELWALPLAPSGGGCQASSTVLCLQGNRFAVTIDWQDHAGNFGTGQAVALTPDTGYFWFFAAANVEVIVKVLDGRGVDGDFWVFYGALSDVGYALTVTDTVTGASRRYENLPGNLASVADTHALSGAAAAARAGAASFSARLARTAPAGSCTTGPGRLCLAGGRFAVEATWADGAGHQGNGAAVTLSGDTGYFWFFGAGNVEVVLKVLDGRGLNGKFWVFYGALSDVEYSLRVTDTATGAVKTYRNPHGRLASVADTAAF
jgi:ELWxxDGT repeat protein